jgi:hypothetical protein
MQSEVWLHTQKEVLPRHLHGAYGHYHRWHWHSLLLQHWSIPRSTGVGKIRVLVDGDATPRPIPFENLEVV